jgi:hypothetical protein
MSNTHHAAFAAIALALLPAVSLAARPDTNAAHACAEAFVASIRPAGSPAPKLKSARFYGIDDLLGAPSEISLTAVNPRTGATVARGSCALSATGKVLSISAVPL